jgi:surface protein
LYGDTSLKYILLSLILTSCNSQIEVSNPKINSTYSQVLKLSSIPNQTTAREGIEIQTIDANISGKDIDTDGNPITYNCYYDQDIDSNVETVTNCSTLSELVFSPATGILDWTPRYGRFGNYEFKITADNGSKTDSTIFSIEIIREDFVSTWRTFAPTTTITLPIQSGLNYNFDVDWGDGTPIENYTVDSGVAHTYASSGDYVVTISGLMEGWDFNSTSVSKDNIISVDNFGDMGWIDLQDAFYDCSNLESFSGGGTFRVTDFSYMLQDTVSLTSVDFTDFKTTSATTLAGMFSGVSMISNLDLSSFDTSNVLRMDDLFYNMTSLTSLDISSFDTSNVQNMGYMFQNVSNISSLTLTHFDTSSVTTMAQMFDGAAALNSLDLSSFRTRDVVDMDSMFEGTSSLLNLDVNGWDISGGPSSTAILNSTNIGLTVFCDPPTLGASDFFGEACN